MLLAHISTRSWAILASTGPAHYTPSTNEPSYPFMRSCPIAVGMWNESTVVYLTANPKLDATIVPHRRPRNRGFWLRVVQILWVPLSATREFRVSTLLRHALVEASTNEAGGVLCKWKSSWLLNFVGRCTPAACRLEKHNT